VATSTASAGFRHGLPGYCDAEIASISERRFISFLWRHHRRHKTSEAAHEGYGLNSGFMLPQYTAAVSCRRTRCSPSCIVDSIRVRLDRKTTFQWARQRDELLQIVKNAETVIAIK